MNSIHAAMQRQGLVRPQQGRIIGGVCAGLAQKFGMDPNLARIIFVVALVVLPGSPFLIYPLLWLAMPSQ